MDGWSNKEILEKISNDELEYAFDVVRDITSISFSIRNKSKIKRRWPLESAFIYCPNTMFLKIPEIREILHEQLNIQNLIIEQLSYENNIEKIIKLLEKNAPIIPSININIRNVAKRVKSDIKFLLEEFSKSNSIDVLHNIQKKGFYSCKYSDTKSIDLYSNDLDITYDPIENYNANEKDNILILINISRNDDLIAKGLVRDLSRNLQQLRKELGFNPTQILSCAYITNLNNDEISRLTKYYDDIKNLVRVKDVILSELQDKELNYKVIDIDGKELKIYIY
jgi:isoleucyl-tRNA synthetase